MEVSRSAVNSKEFLNKGKEYLVGLGKRYLYNKKILATHQVGIVLS